VQGLLELIRARNRCPTLRVDFEALDCGTAFSD